MMHALLVHGIVGHDILNRLSAWDLGTTCECPGLLYRSMRRRPIWNIHIGVLNSRQRRETTCDTPKDGEKTPDVDRLWAH
jgi:hypothetical protein